MVNYPAVFYKIYVTRFIPERIAALFTHVRIYRIARPVSERDCPVLWICWLALEISGNLAYNRHKGRRQAVVASISNCLSPNFLWSVLKSLLGGKEIWGQHAGTVATWPVNEKDGF